VIQFITGKPGDGKSLFSTALILRDLIETEAYVVTNIPLKLPEVNAHVTAKRSPDAPAFNIDERLRVISDAETYEFYRVRSGGLRLPESPDMAAKNDATARISRPEFIAIMKAAFMSIAASVEYQRPCHYYIDEAHNFFNSREWATAGRGLLYYASQHRHLHDEIIFITQVIENVEKQLRSLASETHTLRNNLRRRVGVFRLRPRFVVKSFYGVPSDRAEPFSVEHFYLDPSGVAACYKTVGALGIYSTPEKKVNRAALPWWSLYAFGALVVLLVGGFFAALPYFGKRAVDSAIKPVHVATQVGAQPAAPFDSRAFVPPAVVQPPPSPRFEPAVWATGYVLRGGTVNVLLSDGTVVTERESVTRVSRNSVTVGGRVYSLRASPRPEGAPANRALGVQVDRALRVAADGEAALPHRGGSSGDSARNVASESPPPVQTPPAPPPQSGSEIVNRPPPGSLARSPSASANPSGRILLPSPAPVKK